jgi:hypothetical protein
VMTDFDVSSNRSIDRFVMLLTYLNLWLLFDLYVQRMGV